MIRKLCIGIIFISVYIQFSNSILSSSSIYNTKTNIISQNKCINNPDCIIAIGDVHGDLGSFKKTLRLNGITNSSNNWIGGSSKVIQMGDLIDRGPDDKKVIEFVMKLQSEAILSGGEYIQLLGNHEFMNLNNDFRYAYDGSEYFRKNFINTGETGIVGFGSQSNRIKELSPNTNMGKWLRNLPVIYRWRDDTLFVHAGITSSISNIGIENINDNVKEYWFNPDSHLPNSINTILWDRTLSTGNEPNVCIELEQVLSEFGVKRLVLGHTITDTVGFEAGTVGIKCGGKLVLSDVGMSRFYEQYGIPSSGEVAKIFYNDKKIET